MNAKTKEVAPLVTLVTKLSSGQMQQAIASSLPAHIPADKFIRAASSLIQNSDAADWISSNKVTQKSVLQACTKAAQDGLLLDGKESALVKFGNEATYMPMVQGILKKARNSGKISKIDAVIVHQNDPFKYNPAEDEVPDHNPDWFAERGEMIGVYAVARLSDGTPVVEVMSKAQILAIASDSRNTAQYTGKHAGEWWRKTALRRICKYLPSSTDLDGVFDTFDEGFSFDNAGITDTPEPEAKQPLQTAASVKGSDDAIEGDLVESSDEYEPPI